MAKIDKTILNKEMKTLKTYDGFINENLLTELPSLLKNVVKKYGAWKLVPKIIRALREMPKDVDQSFDYLCNLFNINIDKSEFMKHFNREIAYKSTNEHYIKGSLFGEGETEEEITYRIEHNRKHQIRRERWDKIKSNIKNTLIVLALLVIMTITGTTLSKTYEPKCIETLEKQGYKNIEVVGWDLTSENKEDITSMEFYATDEKGNRIHGVVIVGGSVLWGETYQIKYK